jgi:hypothetical protein
MDRLVYVSLSCILLIAGGAAAANESDRHAAVKAAETESKKQAAVKAAEAWLELVDGGKYGESWETAAELFKKAVRKEQWHQQLDAVSGSLGTVQSRRLETAEYRTALPGAPDGEYVVIQFASSFENKKSAVEAVTPMLDEDGVWRVSGYYIQ